MKRKKTARPSYRGGIAFTKGRTAYDANQPLDANPYSQGSVSAIAWGKGWLKALRDHGRSAA